jgi:hypothetical protein
MKSPGRKHHPSHPSHSQECIALQKASTQAILAIRYECTAREKASPSILAFRKECNPILQDF